MPLRRILSLLAVCIGACAGDGAGLYVDPIEDGVLELGRSRIGPEGGSIELRDGSGITVPRGALRKYVEFSVAARHGLPRDVPAGPELREPAGRVLTVKPHNQRFEKDAELRVAVPPDAEERNLRLHTQKGNDDSAWERIDDDRIELREAKKSDNTLAVLRVKHLSHWAWFEVERQPVSCEPGQAGEDCVPCEAGTYCAGGAPEVACGEEQWDHDGDPATKCRARRVCQAGEHVVDAGDGTRDRECASCRSGTYSDGDNTERCLAWTECVPGEYVAEAGSAQRDQVCEVCEEGTFSVSSNAGRCVAIDACPAGTIVKEPADSTGDVSCEPCQAGRYCAGGASAAEECDEGSWDHDEDPASPCVERTPCPAGQFVVSGGDAVSDRVCSACQAGSYSTATNAPACTAWTTCEPGTHVAMEGSQTTDQTCEECPEGTFSAAENASACTPLGSCPGGTVQTSPGSDTEPPTCADCEAGEYCAGGTAAAAPCEGTWDHDENPASRCVAWTQCVAGEFVDTEGGPTADQACTPCPEGTFSDSANAAECTEWTPCADDEYVRTEGSAISDRVCSLEICGNGHRGTEEVCDDGNTVGGDGCSADCQSVEECGNGTVDYDADEICDDGNISSQDGCSADCRDTESCVRGSCIGARLVAGDNHTCALRDGTVWCWGAGDRGQLGSGEGSLVPVAVADLTDAVALSAGAAHTCALREAGAIVCWGAGTDMQLGNGSSADERMPVPVRGLGQVVGVAAGRSHSCAWSPAGTVQCWGGCAFGQCGIGESQPHVPEPAMVIDTEGNYLRGVVHVTLGQDHSCALVEDSRLVVGARCWGRDDLGQLGLGDAGDGVPHPFAEPVMEFPSATTLAAGRHHSCSVTEEGTAVCWGANEARQLGIDSTRTFVALPAAVSNLARLSDIQAGATHTCALNGAGAVFCWGSGEDFKLGHGSEENAPYPVVVPGLEGSQSNLGPAVEIALGEGHSCALLAEGQVMCWGRGTSGQIGNGDDGTAEFPTPVEWPEATRTLDPTSPR